MSRCRCCDDSASNGRVHAKIELHHVVPRDYGGDDYAANPCFNPTRWWSRFRRKREGVEDE